MYSQTSDFVDAVLKRKYINQQASYSLLWGSVNFFIIVFLLWDIRTDGIINGNWILWWIATIICGVCSLNMLVHLSRYVRPLFGITLMEITDEQKKLLDVSNSDAGFKSPSIQNSSTPHSVKSTKLSELFEATIRTPPPNSPLSGMASPNKSWFASSSINPMCLFGNYSSPGASSFASNQSFSPGHNMSINSMHSNSSESVASNSWIFHGNQSMLDSSYNILSSPKRDIFNQSELSDSRLKSVKDFPVSSPSLFQLGTSPKITTKEELDEYINEFNNREKKRQILCQNESKSTNNNALWTYSTTQTSFNQDYVAALGKNVYQLATKDADDHSSPLSPHLNATSQSPSRASISVVKIWSKRNVDQKQLFQYEENLRIWLSMNILEPLVKQIDLCNDSLSSVTPELKIGNVGVDKLRKAVANITGIKHLNNLLPFLEISIHQDYLVHRLRELSKGGAISAFRWNSGGSFRGKPWREEYPTDTFLILHLFALYMDLHLPPDPTQPDGRVFSNIHLIKTPEKPTSPTLNPVIYLSQLSPPHIEVHLGLDEECDVGKGVKNLLHSLILFCHHLVHEKHGHIGGLNLSLAGINLSWVVGVEK